jgi:hypothetical protein
MLAALPMRPTVRILCTLAAAGLLSAATAPDAGKPAAGPVIVELFTSQGCSSCPPADRLLSKLQDDKRLAGAVIPLAFHVDYWNQGGWTDPFSSKAWSQRQQGYAHAFHTDTIYTPQLVVNGRTQCVGSQEGEVRKRLDEAFAMPSAAQVTVAPHDGAAAGPAGSMVRVTVSARLLRPIAGGGGDLWVALTESGLATPVVGGENARATLHDDHVVRRLIKAFTLPANPPAAPATGAAAAAAQSADVDLAVDASWRGHPLAVVAFLQDPRTGAIYGAAAQPLPSR